MVDSQPGQRTTPAALARWGAVPAAVPLESFQLRQPWVTQGWGDVFVASSLQFSTVLTDLDEDHVIRMIKFVDTKLKEI